MAESCGNCRYKFALTPAPGMPTVTVCRRYPPLASLIQQNIGMPVTVTYWPGTSDENWCGEWRSTEEALIRHLHGVPGGNDAST